MPVTLSSMVLVQPSRSIWVTGPIDSLPPALASLYKLLSARALELVGDSLPAETRIALQRLLG